MQGAAAPSLLAAEQTLPGAEDEDEDEDEGGPQDEREGVIVSARTEFCPIKSDRWLS
jgi:hypothetical protein